MQIVRTSNEIKQITDKLISENKKIGFVPTMGALHNGHVSLLKKCNEQNDVSIVSIFVNPTQFNNVQDFLKYPKNEESDLKKLQQNSCNLAFIPDVKEIYPTEINIKYELGFLETIMEGKFRPGHFQGVANVVSILFDLVKPNNAYFGLKDFQQLAVIKKLVEIKKLNINIFGCPIVRENNGLAMSSRNLRLTEIQKENASVIYKTLCKFYEYAFIDKINEFIEWGTKNIDSTFEFKTEYIEVVDTNTLEKISSKNNHKNLTCCIAAYCNDVRLIDNIQINL